MNSSCKLHNLGRRLWQDCIARALLDSGTLARRIAEESVRLAGAAKACRLLALSLLGFAALTPAHAAEGIVSMQPAWARLSNLTGRQKAEQLPSLEPALHAFETRRSSRCSISR